MFSEDEAEVSWSEFDSTLSSSANMDTTGSSELSYSSASTSFSTTATNTTVFDDDFCGFTDADLSYDLFDESEYYLADYLELSAEIETSWEEDEHFWDGNESLESGTSVVSVDGDLDWSNIPFDEEDYCQCHCEDDDTSCSGVTPETLDETDNDYDYYAECEAAVLNIPFDDNDESSKMLDFYKEQIAECAKEVIRFSGEGSAEEAAQISCDNAIAFDLALVPLPGESLMECCLCGGSDDDCDKWLLYQIDDLTDDPNDPLYFHLVQDNSPSDGC